MTISKSMMILVVFFGYLIPVIAQNPRIAIKNVTLYPSPSAKPILNATILLNNGKIEKVGALSRVKIPKEYRIIDGTGKFATAGFWNCHVHLIGEPWANAKNRSADIDKNLKGMLTSRGYVYAFDLAQFDITNINDIRKLIESKVIDGPTLYAVGVPITSKSPFYIAPAKLPELQTSDEVQKHIRLQAEQGANGVKIWVGSPTGNAVEYMDKSLIISAVEEAKKYGFPVFAHPTDNLGIKVAVENGVSILAHTSPDNYSPWDSSLVETMIKHNVSLIPTLKLYSWELKRQNNYSEDNPLIKTAIQQLNAFYKAGGLILFGTDVGYMADYDPKDEYELMQKSGMSFEAILGSLTINTSDRFGFSSAKGQVAAGFDADIVLLKEDPKKNITNFTQVVMTIHKGRVIYE